MNQKKGDAKTKTKAATEALMIFQFSFNNLLQQICNFKIQVTHTLFGLKPDGLFQ